MVTGETSGVRPSRGLAVLLVPAGLLIVLLVAAPLILLFRISLDLFSPTQLLVEAVSPRNYVAAVSDPYYRRVLATTIRVAFVCTLGSLVLGFPAAYALARAGARMKSLLLLATVFPLLVGNVVRAAGWMTLIGNTGIVNAALTALRVVGSPLHLIYTEGAVDVGIVTVVLPYMILTLAAVIEGISPSVEEAAANLGAGPVAVFRRVVLPLSLPGVAAGCALVFILCMNAYATPLLLGGAQFKMMAPAVYDQFITTTNWPFGAALAFILLAVTLVLTVAGSRVLAGRRTSGRVHAGE